MYLPRASRSIDSMLPLTRVPQQETGIPEPPRINDSGCSDLEFAEIERWVRKRMLEKLDEWKLGQRPKPQTNVG